VRARAAPARSDGSDVRSDMGTPLLAASSEDVLARKEFPEPVSFRVAGVRAGQGDASPAPSQCNTPGYQ